MRIRIEGTRAEIGTAVFHLRIRYHVAAHTPLRKVPGLPGQYDRSLTLIRKDTRP